MLRVGPVMQMSVAEPVVLSVPPPPTMQFPVPVSVIVFEPALPSTSACDWLFENVPDPCTRTVRAREVQPAGASCMIVRAWALVPAWLTGTLVLAVKLVTRVTATRRTTIPAPTRAAITCCGRRRRLLRRGTCFNLPGAVRLAVALGPDARVFPGAPGRSVGVGENAHLGRP